jgi:sigma-B regulation protein RsbU (phosphoserine phosphatase)
MRTSATFTSDFQEEFALETRRLMQRRFLWFTGVAGSLGVFGVALRLASSFLGMPEGAANAEMQREVMRNLATLAPSLVCSALVAAVYWASHIAARRRKLVDETVLRLTFLLAVIDGSAHLVLRALDSDGGSIGWLGATLAHMLAAAFLPWTIVQALRPILAIAVVHAVTLLIFGSGDTSAKLISIGLSPLIGAPGCLLCLLRNSRRVELFKIRFFQDKARELSKELSDARKIHESLFPPPVTEGPIQFDYRYRPMRQIGGDYLYALFSRPETGEAKRLNLVVMDVTGHGIPAALTVNRLHGELNRIYAEDPYVEPGEVLRLLNRYVYLTLADHAVFVTALCIRIDPASNVLEYASGGHPPAFLRAVDGTIHDLSSTAFILGVCQDSEFTPGGARVRLGPGDALIAYTDGAIECRDHMGKPFGITGVRRILGMARPSRPGGWADAVTQAVDAHRHGQVLDDTLVIEVYRRLATGDTVFGGHAQRGLSRYGIKVETAAPKGPDTIAVADPRKE